MTKSSWRGNVFLWLSVFLVLAQVADAFVNKQSMTSSLSKRKNIPTVSNYLVNTISQDHHKPSSSSMLMSTEPDSEKSKSSGGLPFWLDPGTRGGAVVLSIILFILPLIGYSIATNFFGVDGVEAGKYIGVGFTAVATLVWVFTYIFRVATKDMTYVSSWSDVLLYDTDECFISAYVLFLTTSNENITTTG